MPAPLAVHVINLARSSARMARFRALNPHLGDVQRFEAVDGSAVDRAALIVSGDMLADCPYGPGTLGCALSHVALWRKAVAENRPLTVMEDDALVAHRFAQRAEHLLGLAPPDWDFMHWGYVYGDRCNLLVDLGFSKVSMDFYECRPFPDPAKFQAADTEYFMFRLLNSFGLQAYSVSPRGARMLLAACLPLRRRSFRFDNGVTYQDNAIDCAMNQAYPKMQAYVCFPPLVIQEHDAQSVRRSMDEAALNAAS